MPHKLVSPMDEFCWGGKFPEGGSVTNRASQFSFIGALTATLCVHLNIVCITNGCTRLHSAQRCENLGTLKGNKTVLKYI